MIMPMSLAARGSTEMAEQTKKASGCGGATYPPGPMTNQDYDSM
jgi:hypothetical protein